MTSYVQKQSGFAIESTLLTYCTRNVRHVVSIPMSARQRTNECANVCVVVHMCTDVRMCVFSPYIDSTKLYCCILDVKQVHTCVFHCNNFSVIWLFSYIVSFDAAASSYFWSAKHRCGSHIISGFKDKLAPFNVKSCNYFKFLSSCLTGVISKGPGSWSYPLPLKEKDMLLLLLWIVRRLEQTNHEC